MTHLDLFSGSGIGMLAAEKAGLINIGWVESDPICQHCLLHMWPNVKGFMDITGLKEEEVSLLGRVDVLSGGFPCQDISSAGKGEGIRGSRSGLWFEFLRIVRIARPAWVLAENSPILRVRGADVVLDGLEAEGYTCWPVVVGAHCAGAAHKRERVWIVARADTDGNRAGYPVDEAFKIGDGENNRVFGPHCGDDGGGHLRGIPAGTWADADGSGRLEQCRCRTVGQEHATAECGSPFNRFARSPLQPEQHEWEHPRIIGTDADSCTEPSAEPLLGGSVHGVPRTLPPFVRRNYLRILGNAWVPEIPYQIFRWMKRTDAVEQEP